MTHSKFLPSVLIFRQIYLLDIAFIMEEQIFKQPLQNDCEDFLIEKTLDEIQKRTFTRMAHFRRFQYKTIIDLSLEFWS